MKPAMVPHTEYQKSMLEQLQEHYADGALLLHKNDWSVISKCYITDLSSVSALVQHTYSDSTQGTIPRDPASMMRAFLLMLFVRPEEGITKWVQTLQTNRLYALLSGFEIGDVPGVGTFYDFFHRLWNLCDKNRKGHKQRRRKKPKKGRKPGEKAPTVTPNRVKRIVARAMKCCRTKRTLPTDSLFSLFQDAFLSVSAKLGLLGDVDQLTIAGDATPVTTAVYPRSKPACACRAEERRNCGHPRHYSQPDTDTGWNSSHRHHYNGYSLYYLTAADSPYDLPLYPKFQPASRHDSVSFVLTFSEFSQRFTVGTTERILLDAAHDARAIYDFIIHHGCNPFIDLNERTKKKDNNDKGYDDSKKITISPQGIPICPAGLEMKQNGYDHTQKRQKWRCPLMENRTTCTCENPCSNAKFGRTFHTSTKDDPRLFPEFPRSSEAWDRIFARRTTVERTNKRTKTDYKLEAGRHRSTMMWAIRTYAIMMCQHVDAWYSHREGEMHHLISTILPQAA
ncbi:transposase [Bacillus sp. FSL W7-1360]